MEMKGDNVNPSELKTCVVFGGRGLIGRSLVQRLLKLTNWIVRVADSSPHLQLDHDYVDDSLLSQALASDRAFYFHVDMRNKDQIIRAVENALVVFYTDATDPFNNDFYFCHSTIVQGVKNVINACRENKVKRLIFNSPADVVYDGAQSIQSGDESLPYGSKFTNMLTDLKAQAEALALLANDVGGLLTCVIRYSNVFGPGDKQLVPSLVNVANSSWAKFIIGSGESKADFTYVENVAHANLCVEEALTSKMVSVSGKVFFITNLEPMKFWQFTSLLLNGLSYDRPVFTVPAVIVKFLLLLAKLLHMDMESISVHNVLSLSLSSRTFNCLAAQRQIGYSTVVTLAEGIAITVRSFPQLAQGSILSGDGKFSELSKADKFLGSGKVADILLWRDETKSFATFISLIILYCWFFLLGSNFVSSVSGLLLLIVVVLTGYRFLPSTLFGFTISKFPSSRLVISEAYMKDSISSVACKWNRGAHLVQSLAQGEDWSTFLMVITLLYLFKLVSKSLTVPMGVVLALAFTVFYIYEQYEVEMDVAAKYTIVCAQKVVAWLSRNLVGPLEAYLPGREVSPDHH